MNKSIIIAVIAIFMSASICSGEQIKVKMAVGCPTISSYQQYIEIAQRGNSAAAWQAGANLGCRLMFKGDKVDVVDWKVLKNLVKVHPAGNSMSFWLPSEFVTAN